MTAKMKTRHWHWGSVMLSCNNIIGCWKRTSQINLRPQPWHLSEKVERSVDPPTSSCLHTGGRKRNAVSDAEQQSLRHQESDTWWHPGWTPDRHTTAGLLAWYRDFVYWTGGSLFISSLCANLHSVKLLTATSPWQQPENICKYVCRNEAWQQPSIEYHQWVCV